MSYASQILSRNRLSKAVRSTFAIVALTCCTSCAHESPFSVTLSHSGGFSGTTQSVTLDERGKGTRTGQWPTDSTHVTKYTIDRSLTRSIADLLKTRHHDLDTIRLNGKGNLTTSLSIVADSVHNTIAWPNLDPPYIGTDALDSLYHLMRQVESRMTSEAP